MIFIGLMSERPHTVILHGFDRSGSSAISRSLAMHEGVELFMQPFNSGPVRHKMYQLWTDGTASRDDVQFFEGLAGGVLHRDYIVSHWFEQYSSTQVFVPGHLHLVKTTINHFLVDWTAHRFPEIHQWAIWRDPYEILASLVLNQYDGEWYQGALTEIGPAIASSSLLSEHYQQFFDKELTALEATALLIATRSHYLFHHIRPDQVMFYEDFCADSHKAMSPFLRRYSLQAKDVAIPHDLNIKGERASRGALDFKGGTTDSIPKIFSALYTLMRLRFPTRPFA